MELLLLLLLCFVFIYRYSHGDRATSGPGEPGVRSRYKVGTDIAYRDIQFRGRK